MSDRITVFHPGTQHSWQTAVALQQLGRLHLYATSIFYQPDRWPYRIERFLPPSLRGRVHSEFMRFHHSGIDPACVQTSGIDEWMERIARRSGFRQLSRRIDRAGNRRFSMAMRSHIRSPERFGLWGYNGSSADAFRAAQQVGRLRILDRTIGDWRAYNTLLEPVFERYTEFFPVSNFRIPQHEIDRDDEEYALADVILCGSPFAADTVGAYAADRDAARRVRVLNYCFDEISFADCPPPAPRPKNEPLRFLFLGQAGPRKGIHLVLEAFRRIPPSAATLTIVGDMVVPRSVFARYADRVSFRPTVPRTEVPSVFAAADVLLFPSYFEGSALSLLEALAAGVGIIQSANAGVGVTPETGLLLEKLSEESVYDAMMTAIEDRERVEAWRAAGPEESKRYHFSRYRENIAALLEELDQ